ncbi:mobilization protein [Rhizobium grahamii CCGE 502]|uniref:Mobilization protein n=1 Tax=Rhizobium grahamii CCGE 502 TaxID=990285 RepID=S3HGB1_9HYPH|nr:mobilization protein [Rhizobium grahamii CCGE 502]
MHTRFASTEWIAAQRAARHAGMTLSAFIRSLALDGADVLPFLTEEDRAVFEPLHHDLRTIGVNLNDLVRLSKQHNVSPDIAIVLSDLQLLLVGLKLELRRLAARPGRKIRERD